MQNQEDQESQHHHQEEENQQNTATLFDSQTLENLAAFLSREPDEEPKIPTDDQLKKYLDKSPSFSTIH